jgi:hypothetical protein
MISVWHSVIACLADKVFTVLCCWVAVHLFVFAGLSPVLSPGTASHNTTQLGSVQLLVF